MTIVAPAHPLRPGGVVAAPHSADDAPNVLGLHGLDGALRQRLFVLVLGGLQVTCALATAAALLESGARDVTRTAALAAGLALLAALARRHGVAYEMLRRWPALTLTAPIVAAAAWVLDGVINSPLGFVVAVSITLPAVRGRCWAMTGATMVATMVVGAQILHPGASLLNVSGPGAAGYVIWAVVLCGLAVSLTPAPAQPDPAPTAIVPTARPTTIKVDDQTPTPAATVAPEPVARAASQQPRAVPDLTLSLTARQSHVIALLADGHRAADIAARLGITTSTVYRHVATAKQRVNVRSSQELIAIAVSHRLMHPTNGQPASTHSRSAHDLQNFPFSVAGVD